MLITDYSDLVAFAVGLYYALNSETDFSLWYGELCSTLMFVFILILQPYYPIRISPVENSGCFPRGKPTAKQSRYSTYGASWVF